MKKMNILFILITSILIFGITNVYADSYTFISNYSNSSRTMNFNALQPGAYNSKTIDFNTNLLDLTNYSNMTGKITAANTTKYVIYTNNESINWSATCSQYGQGGGNNPIQGAITYADGTQASIDLATINRLCQAWSISGSQTTTTTQYNFDNKPTIHVILVGEDYNAYQCVVDTNGNFTCPGGRKYRQMQVGIVSSGVTSDFVIIITNNIIFKLSDTQQIINNNNQNTQTIVNNITDNQINTSDTDTSNIISIPNSNGKNTILDLLMVPINFVTSIINSFSNSCVSYNLGSLLGTDLILPCINLQNILGSGLYNIIDAIFAFGMIFAFIRSVKKFIQKSLLLASDVSSEVSIF